MTDPAYPIADPETGEILASDEAERGEVVALLASRLISAQRAADEIPELRRKLAELMREPYTEGGWAVMRVPAPTPPRRVRRTEVERHAEALRPLGLAPRPQPTPPPPPDKMPGVGEFTSKAARAKLARVGLRPETFVETPEAGEDRIEVVRPRAEAADHGPDLADRAA